MSCSSGLGNYVGLVDCSLDNLLLLGVEVLSQVLVESRLLLLEACGLSAWWTIRRDHYTYGKERA